MRLVKFLADSSPRPRTGLLEDDRVIPLDLGLRDQNARICDFLYAGDPEARIQAQLNQNPEPYALHEVRLLPPIDSQEVWGAGVTYQRSKVARMEESKQGGSFYDLVYTAPRPELFFKATPNRVSGPGQAVRVRMDSNWTVPEPELALVISPEFRLVGFTIGNDVSARDIEGENPLYLPQAKVYDACCGLGPAITLTSALPNARGLAIRLMIDRRNERVFDQETSVSRMVRTFDELIGWLSRDHIFPDGVILLTGAGIVPPDDFSLEAGDVVTIHAEGIGSLINTVVKDRPDATTELPLSGGR